MREITVSHWGNIYVDEHYIMVRAGSVCVRRHVCVCVWWGGEREDCGQLATAEGQAVAHTPACLKNGNPWHSALLTYFAHTYFMPPSPPSCLPTTRAAQRRR